MKEIEDILRLFASKRDEPFALATLIAARGSTYRRPGARMLISAKGETAGSLSAGCLEEEVTRCAHAVIATGKPVTLHFDTRLRFGCNGSIEIFVERLARGFLAKFEQRWHAREEIYLVTSHQGEHPAGSRFDFDAKREEFLQILLPPIQLIIFGDFPDNRPMRRLALELGWSVQQWTRPEEIPATLDQRTAVIVKSHNYGRDFVALQKLLPMNLRYLGLIGPRARRDQLLHLLLEQGIPQTSELFAPAGLDLGAETPEEIALALIAEIQMTFAIGSGESLRDRRAPIHANIAPPHTAWVASAR